LTVILYNSYVHGVYFTESSVRQSRKPDERAGGAIHDADREGARDSVWLSRGATGTIKKAQQERMEGKGRQLVNHEHQDGEA